jgi:HPt (histidine-containing phosphotransfer) domain-containing protein
MVLLVMDEKTRYRSDIRKALDSLKSSLGGNGDGLRKIVKEFLRETSSLFDAITGHLLREEWNEAAGLIHKIRTRYGYLRMDNLASELDAWEMDLNRTAIKIHFQKVRGFRERNIVILEELQMLENQ